MAEVDEVPRGKLRREAAEAAVLRDRATNKAKREMFDRLHKRFNQLADEVEQVRTSAKSKT